MYSYHTNINWEEKDLKFSKKINNNNKKINTGRGSPLTNLLISIHLTCS